MDKNLNYYVEAFTNHKILPASIAVTVSKWSINGPGNVLRIPSISASVARLVEAMVAEKDLFCSSHCCLTGLLMSSTAHSDPLQVFCQCCSRCLPALFKSPSFIVNQGFWFCLEGGGAGNYVDSSKKLLIPGSYRGHRRAISENPEIPQGLLETSWIH